MAKNSFTYNSSIEAEIKKLFKDERKVLRSAGNIAKKAVESSIASKGLVDSGNLLKGVKVEVYNTQVLVGVTAPGFHAAIVEYGTEEERVGKDGQSSGRMPATPFMLPAFRSSTASVQKKLSEEW